MNETSANNGAKMREALSKFCAYSAVVLNTGMFNRVHLEALLNMAKAALAAPPRNCDIPAKDMDELCDRFCDYVRRNNPACIRPSPLYTYYDAMKWMLDEANTNKEA